MMISSDTDALLVVLGRMEQTLASRIGAGSSLDAAWQAERWGRELRRELVAVEVVAPLLDRIVGHLAGARSSRDVHEAFARMRERLAALQSAS